MNVEEMRATSWPDALLGLLLSIHRLETRFLARHSQLRANVDKYSFKNNSVCGDHIITGFITAS